MILKVEAGCDDVFCGEGAWGRGGFSNGADADSVTDLF